MRHLPRLSVAGLVLILGAVALSGSGAASYQDQPARTRTPLNDLADALEALEARIAALEALHEPPPPRPRPDPPRPDPDPPVDGEWPPAQEVEVLLTVRGGVMPVQMVLPEPSIWTAGPASRRASTWGTLLGLHVRAFWDQTERGDSYVTVQIVNAYPDAGPVRLGSSGVLVDGDLIARTAQVLLPPRVGLPYATTWPTNARAWSWVPDDRPFPAWSEQKAREEVARRAQTELLFGVWPYWWYDQDQNGDRVPRSPGSPAGYGIAPFDGGDGDYLTGPWGKAARWAWCLAETWRGYWFLDPETGEPMLRDGMAYWTGRESQVYQPELHLDGYGWTPRTTSEREHETHTRAEDGPHFRRTWGGAAAIDEWCGVAAWATKMAAYDVMQDWHLDPDETPNGHLLLGGLSRRILQARMGSLVPPQPSGILGSRYLAQSLFALCEAQPWLDPELFEEYATGFLSFGSLITGTDGVTNRDTSGDTAGGLKAPHNLRGPLVSMFHQRLVCGAYRRLGELGFPRAEALADRMATFLGPDPTPYAVEAWQMGPPGAVWQDRKHTASPALAASQRWWSPDGGNYAAFTHGILPPRWPTVEAFDADARQMGLEENWYAIMPREVWEPLWVADAPPVREDGRER